MFFFSSRGRHTRLQGDWSSDVCSSDLAAAWPNSRDRANIRFTARRAARLPASAKTRSASGRRPTSRSSASTCDGSTRASFRTSCSNSASRICTVAERPRRLTSNSSANSVSPSSTGVSRFLTASRTASGTMLCTTERETYYSAPHCETSNASRAFYLRVMTNAPPDLKRESFEKEALFHLDVLYRVALRLTANPSDADDLVQETMLKAYRAWDQYEKGTNAKAWLLTI